MGMATFTENQNQIEKEFNHLKTIFDKLRTQNSELKTLSMGMSGDFPLAISCGSTMVRIGSSIFGRRYKIIDELLITYYKSHICTVYST